MELASEFMDREFRFTEDEEECLLLGASGISFQALSIDFLRVCSFSNLLCSCVDIFVKVETTKSPISWLVYSVNMSTLESMWLFISISFWPILSFHFSFLLSVADMFIIMLKRTVSVSFIGATIKLKLDRVLFYHDVCNFLGDCRVIQLICC